MHIEIIGAKTSICNEEFLVVFDFLFVGKGTDCLVFILKPCGLYLGINILLGKQVIKCHKVNGEVALLLSDIGIPVLIGMEGESGAVTGNQLIAMEQCGRAAFIIELVQQSRKRLLGQFVGLLNMSRFGDSIFRCSFLAEVEVPKFFQQAAFGGRYHEKEQVMKG